MQKRRDHGPSYAPAAVFWVGDHDVDLASVRSFFWAADTSDAAVLVLLLVLVLVLVLVRVEKKVDVPNHFVGGIDFPRDDDEFGTTDLLSSLGGGTAWTLLIVWGPVCRLICY